MQAIVSVDEDEIVIVLPQAISRIWFDLEGREVQSATLRCARELALLTGRVVRLVDVANDELAAVSARSEVGKLRRAPL